MKTKTFIAPFIVGLLIAVAIVIGYKDKAEAVEPTQFEERINLDEYAEGITFIDCNFATTEPNEPELLIIIPELRKFEDRDPNEILIHFSLDKDDRETQEVILDIDPNGLLRLQTVNCDLKEAAKVVWELMNSLIW